jgi:hypothetical protein
MPYATYGLLCDQCGRETPADELVPVSTPELKLMCEDCDLTWGVGFNHWLAGFIDGEGSFLIQPTGGPRCVSWQCGLTLTLRRDDRPVLEEIMRRTEVGVVYDGDYRRGRSSPTSRWQVMKKPDVIALKTLLAQCRLRSKKARDYAIWFEAVNVWATVGRNGGVATWDDQWSRMAELAEELKSGRCYRDDMR